MKDVRIDQDGDLRCWNCGAKGFTEKRTFRSKALVGVGALMTKKKLKCQVCGEYNDTGSAKQYDGPASRKYRKQYEAEKAARASAPASTSSTASLPALPPTTQPATTSTADELAKLAKLRDDGVLTPEEFQAEKSRLLGNSGG